MFVKVVNIVLFLCIVLSNVFAVEKIVVTGNRIGEAENKTSQKILVFEEEELKTYRGENVADFLKSLNMGHIHDYPGLNTAIDVRGFRTDAHGNDLLGKVLILIDGRRAGTGNLSLIPMTNVERIEIIRGPAGIQYGTAAMGGVVNIILKKGKEEGEVFVEGSLGSFDHKSITIGSSKKIKGFDYSIAAKNMDQDDYETKLGKYPGTDTGERSVSLTTGYSFDANRIGFAYNLFDSGDIGYTDRQEYVRSNRELYDDNFQKKKLESFDVEFSRKKEIISYNLKYFNGKEEKSYYDPDKDDFWGSIYKNYYKTKFEGVQANTQIDLKYLQFTAGFDYSRYKTKNRNSDDTPPFNPDSKYSDIGFFAMPKLILFEEKIIITFGARYDIYKLEIQETPMRDDVEESDKKKHPDTYSFGIRYNVSSNFAIRGNYGEAYVIPQAEQLNANYTVWGTPYKGNHSLDPEKSKTYEIGVDYNNSHLNGYLTYFYTKYKDKIITVFTDEGYFTWINSDKATLRGIEGGVKFDIGGFFNLPFVIEPYGNFVFYDKIRDHSLDTRLLYISKKQGSFGLFVTNSPDDFFMRFNTMVTGKQLIDDYDPVTYTTTRKMKNSFTVADLTIGKRLIKTEKFGEVHLRFDVNNIFDKKYAYVEGYYMPEINFKASAKYVYSF